jgi:GT2 family glycosyltransferase
MQMNSAAQLAAGDTLLFLHADTQVRNTSLAQIETALQNPGAIGGGFARRFDSGSLFLEFTCRLATVRGRYLGWFLGDQGIFVRRTVFDRLHGFKEMLVFEDLDFSRRLARAGKVVTISPGIVSSARRFGRRGPFLTTFSDFWLTCRYLAGRKADISES